MFKIGDLVTVREPFLEFFPGVWEIVGVNPETGAFQIADGVDFDAMYLENAE